MECGGGGASREHWAKPRSVGISRWGVLHTMNLVIRAAGLPTSLYSAGHRGPSTISVRCPRSGWGSRFRWVVGLVLSLDAYSDRLKCP